MTVSTISESLLMIRLQLLFDAHTVAQNSAKSRSAIHSIAEPLVKCSVMKNQEEPRILIHPHTPSIAAFRHLPPRRKDVVNQCLEFDSPFENT